MTVQQALSHINMFDSRSSPAGQTGKLQVTLEKSGLKTQAGMFHPSRPAFWVVAEPL